MSTGYTRVTITSQSRNAEMLLPSQREVAALIPEILNTIGAPHSQGEPQMLTLTPVGGPNLLPHQSLQAAGIRDGVILSLDRLEEAVPQPLVYDLAEEAERDTDEHSDVWRIEGSRVISSALFTIFLMAALLLSASIFEYQEFSWWSLGVAGASLVGLGAVPHHLLRWDAEFLTTSAAAMAVTLWWGLPDFVWSEWVPALWLALAVIAWHVGRRQWQAALLTVVTGLILAGLWWGSYQIFPDPERVTAIAGIGTVLVLGLAPRLALMLSGMTALDDATAAGDRRPVAVAAKTFRNAHYGLLGAVTLCALSAVAAVHGLVEQGVTRWTLPLSIALILLTALRSRNMPLALERTVLLISASVSTVVLVMSTVDSIPEWLLITAPLVLAAIPLLLRMRQPPQHVAARLRLNARRLEALAALSLIPLLLGLFGLYSQLTGTFQD